MLGNAFPPQTDPNPEHRREPTSPHSYLRSAIALLIRTYAPSPLFFYGEVLLLTDESGLTGESPAAAFAAACFASSATFSAVRFASSTLRFSSLSASDSSCV